MNSSPSPRRIAIFGECMIEFSGQPFGNMTQGYGGDTFNTATYLARCAGAQVRVAYATGLGTDSFSRQMLSRWRAEGLDTSLVQQFADKLPGLYIIETDAQGERSFSFWRETSAARAYFDGPSSLLESDSTPWNAFYFSGISLAILSPDARERLFTWVAAARARGVQIIFDNNYRARLWPSPELARDVFTRAFGTADLALITLDDHRALYGFADDPTALHAALALPCAELAIKRGAQPTLVRAVNETLCEVPTARVDSVVDTTAAGDAFAAGYLSMRLLGASASDAATFGNQLAARVIQHPGAIIPREVMTDLMPQD